VAKGDLNGPLSNGIDGSHGPIASKHLLDAVIKENVRQGDCLTWQTTHRENGSTCSPRSVYEYREDESIRGYEEARGIRMGEGKGSLAISTVSNCCQGSSPLPYRFCTPSAHKSATIECGILILLYGSQVVPDSTLSPSFAIIYSATSKDPIRMPMQLVIDCSNSKTSG